MHRSDCAAALITAAGLLFASAARAEQTPTVWYRAAEHCPDAQAFLHAVGTANSRSRLAAAGDRIDFVVTILSDQNGSLGRLERATEAGTVAIREVRDPSCERVAEALALSLGLALGPQTEAQRAEQVASAPASVPETAAPPEPARQDVAPERTPSSKQAAAATPEAVAPPRPTNGRSQPRHAAQGRADSRDAAVRPEWAVGVHGGLLTGLQPRVVGRYGALAEVGRMLPTILPRLVLRAGVVAALGSYDTEIGPVRRWLGAVQVGACPVALGDERLSVAPCVEGELGASGASGNEQGFFGARTIWGALTAAARGTWRPASRWSVYLDLGALAPLGRQRVTSDGDVLYQTRMIVLSGSLGVLLRLE